MDVVLRIIIQDKRTIDEISSCVCAWWEDKIIAHHESPLKLIPESKLNKSCFPLHPTTFSEEQFNNVKVKKISFFLTWL